MLVTLFLYQKVWLIILTDIFNFGSLKAAQQELDDATKRCEEEIQVYAHDLFRLVDSVSKYKEFVESKISSMRNGLSETADAVLDTYKGTNIE